jgi:DNA-binding NarL/FixJ family response regulator
MEVALDARVIRVLIADDHPLMRRGLVEEINSQEDMKIVAEAATGRECVQLFDEHRPDVALIDLRMPDLDGIETISAIRAKHPAARTVVLTTELGEAQIFKAFQVGAVSYLLKSMVRKQLIETIRMTANGQRRIPPQIAERLADFAINDALSPREISVLQKAATGCSNKMIADALKLSEHTVKTHFKNILSKLGANDRTHAVTLALQRGYFQIEHT